MIFSSPKKTGKGQLWHAGFCSVIESKVEDKRQESPMESCLENRDNCIESLKRSLTDKCHLENLKYKEKKDT